jgi:hypothetical protein
MAAFTRADPSDRTAFDAHYERIRNDPSCTLRAIDDDGEFVGTVGSFTMEGQREVTYLDRTCAMGARPGVAGAPCVPCDRADPAAIRSCGASQSRVSEVLARAGSVEVGRETSFAPGVGAEIVELIYRLDHQATDPES